MIEGVTADGRRCPALVALRMDAVGCRRVGRCRHRRRDWVGYGGPHAPNLAADLTERLRRNGDDTIADTRCFRRDVRSSATPDQVLSVDASVVRLNRRCRDRITAFD